MHIQPIPQASQTFSFDHYHALIAAKKYAAAFRMLQPEVARDPLNPDFLEAASDCYWHLGEEQKSVTILDLVVDRWPHRLSSSLGLGARLSTLGNTERAALHLSKNIPREAAGRGQRPHHT